MRITFVLLLVLLSTLLPIHSQTWQQTNGPLGGNFKILEPGLTLMWNDVAGFVQQAKEEIYYSDLRWFTPTINFLDTMDIDGCYPHAPYNSINNEEFASFFINGKVWTAPVTTRLTEISPAIKRKLIFPGVDSLYLVRIHNSRAQINVNVLPTTYFSKTDMYVYNDNRSLLKVTTDEFPRNANREFVVKDYSCMGVGIGLICLDSAGSNVWYYGRVPEMYVKTFYPFSLFTNTQVYKWTALDFAKKFPAPIHWARFPIDKYMWDADFLTGGYTKAFVYAADTLYTIKIDTLGNYSVLFKGYLPYDESHDWNQNISTEDIRAKRIGLGSYMSYDTGRTWQKFNVIQPRLGVVTMTKYAPYKYDFDRLCSSTKGMLYRSDTTLKPLNYGLKFAPIRFLNRTYKTIYAVTEGGDLFTTNDEGETWQMQKVPALDKFNEHISSVGSYNDYAFMGTIQGNVLRSSDKGVTWSAPMFTTDTTVKNSTRPIFSFFTKDDTLFVSTAQGLYYTLHYGVDWVKANETMKGIRYWARKGNEVYACSPFSKEGTIQLDKGLYYTNDAGKTWHSRTLPDVDSILCMAYAGEYLLLGTTRGLYASKDGGSTWENKRGLFPDKDSVIKDIATQGTTVVMIAGKDIFHFHSSLAQGVTPVRTGLYRRTQPNKLLIDFNTMYLGTSNNSVYKSTDIPLPVEEEERNLYATNETFTIKHVHYDGSYVHFVLDKEVNSQLKFSLYNLLGEEIQQETVYASGNTIHINAPELTSGYYMLSLTTSIFTISKPIIVTK